MPETLLPEHTLQIRRRLVRHRRLSLRMRLRRLSVRALRLVRLVRLLLMLVLLHHCALLHQLLLLTQRGLLLQRCLLRLVLRVVMRHGRIVLWLIVRTVLRRLLLRIRDGRRDETRRTGHLLLHHTPPKEKGRTRGA